MHDVSAGRRPTRRRLLRGVFVLGRSLSRYRSLGSMTGIVSDGGGRAPWSFQGGVWWVSVPLVLLGIIFWAVLRSTSTPPLSPSPLPLTTLTPSFERLPPVLGGHYELWVTRPEGGEDHLAAFTILRSGALLSLGGEPTDVFSIRELPPVGSTLTLTVESGNELAITRSERVLLRGQLSTTEAALEPVLPDVTAGPHVALLVAPTGPKTPDTSGIWFAKSSAVRGKPKPGLELSAPAAGWLYGGFVVTASGTTLPTGTFRDAGAADQGSFFQGSGKGLPVPGEDFVDNAPEGVKFPLNLADGRTVVTLGLLPDFSADASEPFLPLLTARVPYEQKPAAPFPLTPIPAGELPRGVVRFAQQGS